MNRLFNSSNNYNNNSYSPLLFLISYMFVYVQSKQETYTGKSLKYENNEYKQIPFLLTTK